MKYWSILAAKLGVFTLVFGSLWRVRHAWLPTPEPIPFLRYADPIGIDLWYTVGVFAFALLAVGALAVLIIDQRYRCRTCGRRLRMPAVTGSWPNSFLLGPPKTEYICVFGHGTLHVKNLQIAGRELPSWQEHGDIWDELMSGERR